MTKLASASLLGLAAGMLCYGQTAQPKGLTANTPTVIEPQRLLTQYCTTCHNSKAKVAGLALDGTDLLAHVSQNAEVFERVVRKLRAGMMPPPGAPRPDPAVLQTLASGFEAELDRAAVKPNLVAPGVHRVNRAEYANAIHDLLGLDVDSAAFLPVDDSSSGFDNVAGSLTVSPALVEGYMSAAGKISRLA